MKKALSALDNTIPGGVQNKRPKVEHARFRMTLLSGPSRAGPLLCDKSIDGHTLSLNQNAETTTRGKQ